MTTEVKKIRDGMYLCTWYDSVFQVTSTVYVKMVDLGDESTRLAAVTFTGNGTVKVDLELSNLLPISSGKDEENYTIEMLQVIFATKDGRCQLMAPEKAADGSWMWNTSWNVSKPACNVSYHNNYGHCANSPIQPYFSVDISIDFKSNSAYLKNGEKNVLDYLSKLLKDKSVTFIGGPNFI